MDLNSIDNNFELPYNSSSSKISSIDDLSLEYREERDMFRFILENHNDPVFLLRIEKDFLTCSFVDFNQSFIDHLGYSKEEIFQSDPISLYDSESIPAVKKYLSRHEMENSLNWDAVILRKDHQMVPFEIKSFVFRNEKYNLLFVFLHDVSSFKKSLQDLHNHKSLLERSESIGRIGYWEYDLKKNDLWISNGVRSTIGLTVDEFSPDQAKNLILPEYNSKIEQIFENIKTNGGKCDIEFRIRRGNTGETIDVRTLTEFDKNEMKFYGIVQDITYQKKVELELMKAKDKAEESDRLKSAFVSNMSHEIRTPMNGIVGFAHLLSEAQLDNDTREEYKLGIHICCNQLLSRVNDILDIAKIESGQVSVSKSKVNIHKLLQEKLVFFSSLAREKNLNLSLNPANSDNSDNSDLLITDKAKLNKIITNLLDNAIRFTHSGFIEFGYQVHDTNIEFYVKDTGIGISPSHYDIIFQPFRQADNEISQEFGGTGLGLTIAKTYVEMLGGKIWLESQFGKGTTFFFTLPFANSTEKHSEKSPARKNLNQSKTCLVVEDMEINYVYLKALLEPLGFNVLWAKDGKNGIEMALKNDDIDLVLMDIRLPGTDGYEATRIIKEKRPKLPVIAQSAYALHDERKRALEAGCDDYVTKPIYRDEFRSVLSAFFDS